MKKILIFLTLVSVLSACDFIRTVASRPTSAEIEAKRVKIEEAEAARAARIDSVERLSSFVEDSLSLEALAREKGSSIISAGNISGLEASRLKFRYYIVIGSFARAANADRLEAAAEAAGYPVTRISFTNGYSAVAVCGGDALTRIFSDLDSLRRESFCPGDAWVLANE